MRWLEKLKGLEKGKTARAFTIIELVVVMAIVALLATIVILSYNGWRGSVVTNQVKSDLSQAASAMHSAVTFTNTYPASIPDTFKESDGVDLSLIEHTDTTFCIDGTSEQIDTIIYHADQTYTNGGELQSGLCIDRPADAPPEVPTSVAVATVTATTVTLSWVAPSGIVSGYTSQCAQDSGFVFQLKQATSAGVGATVSGVDPTTTIFCRVKASNSAGEGPWSPVVMIDSDQYFPPTSIVASNQTISSLRVSWATNTDAESYSVQCAQNTGYSTGLKSATINKPTTLANFTGLAFNTTYYCRVKTIGASDSSDWSSNLVTASGKSYGNLPIASSIDGYWTSAPTGFMLENGAAISRTQYADLFAIIGTTYGAGDGSTTFNLPDSRGLAAVNLSTDTEFNAVGKTSGEKVHSMTIAEMPSHTHIQNPHNHNGGFANPYVAANAPGIAVTSAGGSAFGFKYNTTTPAPSVAATNQNTGTTQAYNVIQPSTVNRSAIKYTTVDSAADQLPAGTSISGYWSSIPSGYLSENGSAVSRTTYSGLFSAVGTTYGAGDGSTTFNLPDSRGRVGVNLNSSDSEFDTLGERYGEKAHQIATTEIPSHTHIQNAHNHNGGLANPYVHDGSFGGIAVTSLNGSSFGFVLRAQPNVTATNQNTGGGGDSNVIQPSIVKQSAIKHTASVGSSPVTAGTSVASYGTSVPSGYLYENGAAVSRTTYATLFGVIGSTYGAGDGSTTFNLPDTRGRVAVNISSSDSEFNTMGEEYGEKTHLLTVAELVTHTHIQNAHDHNSLVYISDGNFGGTAVTTANGAAFGFKLGLQPSVTATNQNTGGGQAFNVIQPSIVKRFNIKY